MKNVIPVTIAYGDGIGPEIMEAVVYVLKEAAVPLRLETIEIGEKLYNKYYTYGITEDTWSQIFRTKALLKGPVTTPQGGGYKSLNVTLKKTLGLYANVRPSISYFPFVNTSAPEIDVVIIRENEEDLYTGIEYHHTADTYESVKLISRSGSEKIIRFAFEYALKNNRKKISCFSKDNIMKFTDGIFHKTFNEIASQYSNIQVDHYLIDIGSARLISSPQKFDVIVTSNLYGDILSDIAAEISDSIGLAGSANIGKDYSMFEAVHGSAPDIAGQNIANPSGLLNAAIMMLVHLGLTEHAAKIENALKKTIEDGIHTADIYNPSISSKKVGTKEFAQAIINNLEYKPKKLKIAEYHNLDVESNIINNSQIQTITETRQQKKLVGVDVFFDSHNIIDYHHITKQLTKRIASLSSLHGGMHLVTISAKGLKLWPNSTVREMFSDHWCCRFMVQSDKDKTVTAKNLTMNDILSLLNDLVATINNSTNSESKDDNYDNSIKFELIKVENLYLFNDTVGFSLAQEE